MCAACSNKNRKNKKQTDKKKTQSNINLMEKNSIKDNDNKSATRLSYE